LDEKEDDYSNENDQNESDQMSNEDCYSNEDNGNIDDQEIQEMDMVNKT